MIKVLKQTSKKNLKFNESYYLTCLRNNKLDHYNDKHKFMEYFDNMTEDEWDKFMEISDDLVNFRKNVKYKLKNISIEEYEKCCEKFGYNEIDDNLNNLISKVDNLVNNDIILTITHTAFKQILHIDYGKSFTKMLNCRTLKKMLKVLEEISDDPITYHYVNTDNEYNEDNTDDDILNGKYKFIGDLFEIFAEVFLKIYSSDNRIGIYNYQPVPPEDDYGVDGFGKNINGENCTVQIKYRGNPIYELKERDIKQFGYQSIVKYDVDKHSKNNMFIFTNCIGLHWNTEVNVFNDKMNVINGEMISKMIDNNEPFWNSFKDIMIRTVEMMKVEKLTKLFKENLFK